eukprot:373882_1
MATHDQTELESLNPQNQAQENIFKQSSDRPARRPTASPEVLFKKKLKENDGCCTSWCAAHFFLVWLLLENVVQIVISAYQIKVLQDPKGTHEICYNPGNGQPTECYDEREF